MIEPHVLQLLLRYQLGSLPGQGQLVGPDAAEEVEVKAAVRVPQIPEAAAAPLRGPVDGEQRFAVILVQHQHRHIPVAGLLLPVLRPHVGGLPGPGGGGGLGPLRGVGGLDHLFLQGPFKIRLAVEAVPDDAAVFLPVVQVVLQRHDLLLPHGLGPVVLVPGVQALQLLPQQGPGVPMHVLVGEQVGRYPHHGQLHLRQAHGCVHVHHQVAPGAGEHGLIPLRGPQPRRPVHPRRGVGGIHRLALGLLDHLLLILPHHDGLLRRPLAAGAYQ